MMYRPAAWGRSQTTLVGEEKRSHFLEAFLKHKQMDRPVIVSPSMSGSYAIHYMMGQSPSDCTERMRGYVPIAPVHYDKYEAHQYHRCEVLPLRPHTRITCICNFQFVLILMQISFNGLYREAKHSL